MAPSKQLICGAAALGAFVLLGNGAGFTLPPAGQQGALRGSSAAPERIEAAAEPTRYSVSESAKAISAEEPPAADASNFLRTALAVLAALAVAIVPMSDAQAARSGGRMGGGGGMRGGMGRSAPPPRSTARSNTNMNIGVGVAPPIYGGGFGMGFGSPFGFGMPFMPPLFGPTIAIGGGSSAADQQLQNQQRQDERMMDSQKAQIDSLQKQIEELKASKK